MNENTDDQLFESIPFVDVNGSSHDDALQAAVLERTLRHVRNRRRIRRGTYAAVVVATFVSGLLAGRLWYPDGTELADGDFITEADISLTAPSPTASSDNLTKPASSDDPLVLRSSVVDAPVAEQVRLLSRAGDIYLRQNQIEQAVDCYRQVVELAELTDCQVVQPQDSWLLAELKQSYLALNSTPIEVE